MIDWSHVDELKQDMGESFDEIVSVFLQEVQEGLERLGDGPSSPGLAADLHFLRGAALNLGFVSFAELCGEGESRANDGRGAEVDLTAVRKSFDASLQDFTTGLRDRAA